MYQKLHVGEIINTHGIRGEVKVIPLTDDISAFDNIKKANGKTCLQQNVYYVVTHDLHNGYTYHIISQLSPDCNIFFEKVLNFFAFENDKRAFLNLFSKKSIKRLCFCANF